MSKVEISGEELKDWPEPNSPANVKQGLDALTRGLRTRRGLRTQCAIGTLGAIDHEWLIAVLDSAEAAVAEIRALLQEEEPEPMAGDRVRRWQ